MNNRITLDGSHGEGGGQILRSALALSLVTGTPFEIENIRAARPKPGLLRQHLTAVHAAAIVGHARVTGHELGSSRLSFEPSQVRGGDFHLAVGTAGSAVLVLQTVLPALAIAPGPSRLILEGGTHNPFAPPFDFLAGTFLPLLARMGADVKVALESHGFYPAGGGRFTAAISPCRRLMPLTLVERGEVTIKAHALLSALPGQIARRELTIVRQRLGLDHTTAVTMNLESPNGPGNVVSVSLASRDVLEIVTAFGRKGATAEQVAAEACDEVDAYLAADVPVGAYLADQLLVPMALSGSGEFRTVSPTAHTITNIDVIRRFIQVPITVTAEGNNAHRITVGHPEKVRAS